MQKAQFVGIDEANGKALVDRDFGATGPPEDYSWRVPLDPPRDIKAIVWYASRDGTSQEAKDAPRVINCDGTEYPNYKCQR